jgi:hypothetical protein
MPLVLSRVSSPGRRDGDTGKRVAKLFLIENNYFRYIISNNNNFKLIVNI